MLSFLWLKFPTFLSSALLQRPGIAKSMFVGGHTQPKLDTQGIPFINVFFFTFSYFFAQFEVVVGRLQLDLICHPFLAAADGSQ